MKLKTKSRLQRILVRNDLISSYFFFRFVWLFVFSLYLHCNVNVILVPCDFLCQKCLSVSGSGMNVRNLDSLGPRRFFLQWCKLSGLIQKVPDFSRPIFQKLCEIMKTLAFQNTSAVEWTGTVICVKTILVFAFSLYLVIGLSTPQGEYWITLFYNDYSVCFRIKLNCLPINSEMSPNNQWKTSAVTWGSR